MHPLALILIFLLLLNPIKGIERFYIFLILTNLYLNPIKGIESVDFTPLLTLNHSNPIKGIESPKVPLAINVAAEGIP